MKSIKSTLVLIIGVSIMSCGNPATTIKSKVDAQKINELKESDLFDESKVLSFYKSKSIQTEEANQLFLKGIDLLKNKKEYQSSIQYFKLSILKAPSGKAFYEMGNALMGEKKYEDAINSYQLAEKLDFEPFSKILYNISCAYSLMDKVELSGEYLEYALQAGYANIDQIENDADLKNLRKTYRFRIHLKNGLNGVSNPEALYWLQFKRIFKKCQLPLKLNRTTALNFSIQENSIAYDFEKFITEMRDGRFSRDVSNGYYQVASISETANYIAFVYLVKDEFMENLSPVTYRLVTYTLDGKLIDKKEIGGQSSYQKPYKEIVINSDLTIQITLYELKYKKDVEEEGYYDNPIIGQKEIGKEYFTINEFGKIVPINSEVVTN